MTPVGTGGAIDTVVGVRRTLPWAAAAIAVALVLCGLALAPVNAEVPEAGLSDFAIPEIVTALLFPPIGAWIAVRRRRNAVSWLLLLVGVGAAISFFTTQYAAAALVSRRSWHLPLGAPAAALAHSAFIVPNVVLRAPLVFAFPDGRLGSPMGRLVVALSAAAATGFVVAALAVPYPWYADRPDLRAPLAPTLSGYSTSFYEWFGRAFAPVTALSLLVLLNRWRRAQTTDRAAIGWFAAAALVLFVQFSVVQAWFPDFSEPRWLDVSLATAASSLMAIACVVSLLRYRLWDLDVVIRRSAVYVGLTAVLAASYLAVVATVDRLLGAEGVLSSIVAALVVGGLVAPTRSLLQRTASRVLFGRRDDPGAAVVELGRRIGAADDSEELLAEAVRSVAAAVRVPYVALRSAPPEETLLIEHGRESWGSDRLALRVHGEDVGSLVVGRREPGKSLEGADRRLLDDLAHQVGLAAASYQRQLEIRAAHQRVIEAREEERRRLRRDLHDGLGPALAAAALHLDEAAELVETDPVAARALLRRLRDANQELVADIRRIVYGLRPPALDELGLIGALRQHAENLSGTTSFGVTASPNINKLPAAVEVALWRIATEGMTNVVRHANAAHCLLRLDVADGFVWLELRDDGGGMNAARPGVGLASIAERAAELGGSCTVDTTASGTTLSAKLPIAHD